jgi:serine/threonine protein kinase/Flp pilus assembly protein TadD
MTGPADVKSIFGKALDLESTARAAFLDEACGTDATLRARVEGLLHALDGAGDFMNRPARDETTTADGNDEHLGCVIADKYKLIEPIGEGGMGTVWMAQQTEPVKRLVAVKLIKAGMDSRQVIARFEAERQALALMDHPNIARVLDGGTTEGGRPYFVMDLVKGVPITRYCDEHHLTPRQRLELFIPVCQAVQHAHQKGIIHRDLKPSNVLVALYDGKAVPKVIDFGVAKAAGQALTDKTLVTGFGAIVGTLEYMSPEQAELNNADIDTRSDIYSLGALLYELLTGSTPFDRKELERGGMLEMLRVIREQEPTKPSTKLSKLSSHHAPRDEPGHVTHSVTATLASIAANRGTEPAKLTKLVRGELDWIVMKALEKDRTRRYETASAFAADVERYLHDEPVLACPPSAWYRFRKFARRNKRALGTALVGALAVLVVAWTVGWMARDKAMRAAKTDQEVHQILLKAEELRAEAKWSEARAAIRSAQALLAGAGAQDEQQRRADELLRDLTMSESVEGIRLDRAAVTNERFDLAQADLAYARVFREYGIDVQSLPIEEAAARIKGRGIRTELVAALDDWALVRRRTRQSNWKHLVAVARAADSNERRNQLREALETADPESLKKLAASASITSLPAPTLLLLADALTATGAGNAGLALLRQGQQHYPGDFWINHTLARCLYDRRRWDEAIRFYTGAIAVRPESPGAHVNLGSALHGKRDLQGARAAFSRAAALNPNFAGPHYCLGLVLKDMGQVDEAIAEWRAAIRLRPELVWAHNNVGKVCKDAGRIDEAIAAYRETIRVWRQLLAKDSTNAETRCELGGALDTLAVLLLGRGQPRDALPLLEEAIVHQRAALKINHQHPTYRRYLSNHYWHLTQVLLRIGDHPGAAKAALEPPRLFPDDWQEAFGAVERLVRCTWLAQEDIKLPEAQRKALERTYAERVRELVRETVLRGRDNPKAQDSLAWFLANCPEFRDPPQAVQLARRAVQLAPEQGQYWSTLGVAHYRAGEWKAARAALEKSVHLRKSGEGSDFFFLAMAHWRMDDKEEARKWYDRAVEWMENKQPANGELRLFRQEAAKLLGVKEKKEGL